MSIIDLFENPIKMPPALPTPTVHVFAVLPEKPLNHAAERTLDPNCHSSSKNKEKAFLSGISFRGPHEYSKAPLKSFFTQKHPREKFETPHRI